MTEKNAPTIVEALRHALGVAEDLIHDEYDGTSTLEDMLGRLAEDRAALLRAEVESREGEWRPDRCPECLCRAFARIDEQKSDGHFGPGPGWRCVECKRDYFPSALAQPRQPTASVEAVAQIIDEHIEVERRDDVARGTRINVIKGSREAAAAILALTAQHPALQRGGGPTATEVVRVSPPTEGHEQGVRGSEERAGEEGL